MNSRLWCAPILALLFGACSYTSQYVPPVDGRARVVWREGNPVAMVPATGCREGAFSLAQMPTAAVTATAAEAQRIHVHHALWVDLPVYVPFPHGHLHHTSPVACAAPSPVHRAVPANAAPGLDAGSSSGGGGEEFWVVAAVAGLVVMPFIAVGLAASDPEDEEVAAGSIDLVNAYNDLARSPDSPCPDLASSPPAAADTAPAGPPSSPPPPPPTAPEAPVPAPEPAYPALPEVSP